MKHSWLMHGLGIADLFSILECDLRVAESGGRLDTTGILGWAWLRRPSKAGTCRSMRKAGASRSACCSFAQRDSDWRWYPQTPFETAESEQRQNMPKQRSERSGRACLGDLAKANNEDYFYNPFGS